LTTLIQHAKNPKYLEFLNIIQTKNPSKIEIEHYLAPCIIPNDLILLTLDEQTMVLCSHKIDMKKYNNIMITKFFYNSIIY